MLQWTCNCGQQKFHSQHLYNTNTSFKLHLCISGVKLSAVAPRTLSSPCACVITCWWDGRGWVCRSRRREYHGWWWPCLARPQSWGPSWRSVAGLRPRRDGTQTATEDVNEHRVVVISWSWYGGGSGLVDTTKDSDENDSDVEEVCQIVNYVIKIVLAFS